MCSITKYSAISCTCCGMFGKILTKENRKNRVNIISTRKRNPCTLQDIINANYQRYCRGTTKTCVPAVVQKYYIYKIFACFFNFIIFYYIQQKHNLYIYKVFVAYLQPSMLKMFTLYTMMIFPIKFILKSTSLEHLNKIFSPIIISHFDQC